jgi:hypothetical protein
MTQHNDHFALNRPGTLIAALPAVLGFVPQKSLVLASVVRGDLGAVLRVDLSEDVIEELDRLAQVVSAGRPEAVIAVIIDAAGARCPMCNEDYRRIAGELSGALAGEGIDLWAVHVVDEVSRGGRWHCIDGCGSQGAVDDPELSPLTAEAVFEGRRLYATRADLAAVIAADDDEPRATALAGLIGELEVAGRRERSEDPDGCTRRGVLATLDAAVRLASGAVLDDAELAGIGYTLTDILARDTLYALAIGDRAGEAETLWAVLTRTLPAPWRVEALVLLAFSAYARGDGPLAGISLDEAMRCDPGHRMAVMLDTALQSGMRPEKIRQLAQTGYRLAERLGVQLPDRNTYRRRAG